MPSHACTHARTHARTNTHTHARTHAHTHTHTEVTGLQTHITRQLLFAKKAPEMTSDMAGLSGSKLFDNPEYLRSEQRQKIKEDKARLRDIYGTLTRMITGINWVRMF